MFMEDRSVKQLFMVRYTRAEKTKLFLVVIIYVIFTVEICD